MDTSVLDNPIWSSLTGPHAHFAEGSTHALRYPDDVAVFAGISNDETSVVWDELRELVGPGAVVPLVGFRAPIPAEWEVVALGEGVQMVATPRFVGAVDPAIDVLGAADAVEMVELVERTQPGPFRPSTYRLGTYVGVRHEGRLVAMAGERLHPPGWTEISAVCTDEEFRGRGFAGRLVKAVGHGIRARGETPFLHAAATNVNAIRLYTALGFEVRRQVTFTVVQVPA